jgi:AcrR family transcriptional regulator
LPISELDLLSNSVGSNSTPPLIDVPVPATPQRLSKVERTRLRLVESVRAEIERGGGFTAEQVARRAETSPATFYNHFAGKDDALAAAFDGVMLDLVAHVEAHLQVDRLLELGIEAFARDWLFACIRFFCANCMTLRAALAQVPVREEIRRIFLSQEAATLAIYQRFIELGQKARAVRSGNAYAMASALMIQNQGWNHPAVLRLEPGDALYEELAGCVVRHLSPGTLEKGAEQLAREGV